MWICSGHWLLLKIPKPQVFKAVYKWKLVLKKGQGGMSILNQLWPVSRPDFSPSFFSFHTSSADVSPGKPHRIHLSFTDSGSTITSFFLRRKEMTGEGKQPGKQKKKPLQAVLSQWEQWHFTFYSWFQHWTHIIENYISLLDLWHFLRE